MEFNRVFITAHMLVVFVNDCSLISIHFLAGQPTPPNVPPPEIRAYLGLVSLNKALLNPYFWGGYVARGGWLNSHDHFRISGWVLNEMG